MRLCDRATFRALAISASCGVLCVPTSGAAPASAQSQSQGVVLEGATGAAAPAGPTADEIRVADIGAARLAADIAALQTHRPGWPFWQHVFAIPDGSVAFGSAADGRLLAVFPAAGDWTRAGRWEEPSLASLLESQSLPRAVAQRRDVVAQILGDAAGPVMHNPTRGRFLSPNAARFGGFVAEWGLIYERFGVPAEIGLAQAVVESGLSGTIRSEARAIGFCQWLEGNWNHLKRLAPHVIEVQNQTTQAPYCAAYLTILTTKYGSYVPALSEHHAGGANVGRTLINGERLGGGDVVSRYFLGSDFALALRNLPGRHYTDLYRTYGPRSYRYSELVFGNMATVTQLRDMSQERIYAMRTTRNIPLDEVTRRTGLSAAEVKRYNPALVRQVPARATLYLPVRVPAFGSDVAFWHRPPTPEFATALADFMAIEASPDEWDDPAFERVLREHQRRFRATDTEEGRVMATVLAYVMDDARGSRRGAMLREYRSSERITQLFQQGVRATAVTPAVAPR
jgi:hypothetical protein